MRILLKISGEALKGKQAFGVEVGFVKKLVKKIEKIKKQDTELAIVVGGGNIYRGGDLIKNGVSPSDSHSLSMLSTVFNGVILKNFLEKIGLQAVVMDPNGINFVEKYNKNNAKNYLKKGTIVILTGGTGNPFFTTDSGGVLRSLELDCDFMIKATKVDGVYDKDPVSNSDAILYKNISYDEVINQNLKIMDLTAIVLAKENNLKLKVIKLDKKDAIINALKGNSEGTLIN